MTLSIIIPVYNEKKTIQTIIEKVIRFKELEKEVIVVDDCSTDGTSEILQLLSKKYSEIRYLKNEKNLGKGAAIRKALEIITKDIVIIQDADLEYDPKDYPKLLEPILEKNAEVVYGSRFLGGGPVRVHLFWNFLANKILTLVTNILVNMNFTDMETGYKLFKSEVIKSINLKENSFGIEPEITIKLAKKKYIFFEVPISYYGRGYDEGKKIKTLDAFKALYCLLKYSITK